MSEHAVVLGGGLAGMVAAAALAGHPELATVTVVERDLLPRAPAARRGLPQGRHAHVLMASGARVIESLLPGTTQRWLAAGARRIGLPHGYVMLLPQGWLRRWTTEQFVISCSRALLDWVIQEQVRALPRVRLVEGTQATGLTGDAGQVTGVRLGDTTLPAALVVDATGRGSRAPHWLRALGGPEVRQDVVDSGLRYATRVFRAPPRAADEFPIVNIQADPAQDRPGQTAALMPIENGQWLVTLSGTRGGQPPPDEGEFIRFARGMRHPIVADLVEAAEPLGPVWVTSSTANRYRHFGAAREPNRKHSDTVPQWPDGFVVLGDAVASYNPVYGHGMSVAAQGAAALRAELDRRGLVPGLAAAVQRAVAVSTDAAWGHAAGTDIRFPGAKGPAPTITDRLLWRYQSRLFRTAIGRPDVAHRLVDVFSLAEPAYRLMAPRMLLATALGPRVPALTEPPFTPAELAMITT